MRLDLAYLAVGAILGASLRYFITGKALFLDSVPVSVLIVNVLGSFILGFTMTGVRTLGFDQRSVLLVGVGFCGSLTTMSSFAFETVSLIDVGKLVLAGLDLILNVGLSILAIIAG
ncbi:MAG: CrcB family protein [Nitrososphaerota archaeon]|nr:CrcB family protein [Nitrososphaerota archaeon]